MTRGGGASFGVALRDWESDGDRGHGGAGFVDSLGDSPASSGRSNDLGGPTRPFRGPQRSLDSSEVIA